jgi:hypothetical protein
MTGVNDNASLRSVCIALLAALGVTACGRSAASSAGEDGKLATPPRSKEVRDAAKLVEVGQCETAADKLKAYVGDHPEELEAYLVLGDALTCAAFANAPHVVPEKVEGARTAYGSALKLAPKDVRALVSAAMLDLFAGRTADAKSLLESAHALEPKNRAITNFLAVAIGPRDRAAVSSLLSSAYGERKRATAPPAIPGFCRSEPLPPAWPHGVTVRIAGPGSCGAGVLLVAVEIGGHAYPAGTIFDSIEKANEGLSFADRLYPGKRTAKGWVLTGIRYNTGGAFSKVATRTQRIEEGRVVARRVPDLPTYGPISDARAESAKDKAAAAARAPWSRYANGNDGMQKLEDALGVVERVVPNSVKAAGSPENVEAVNNAGFWYGTPASRGVDFAFVFIPVVYDQVVYENRAVDEKTIARLESLEEAVPGLVTGMDFFSPEEKRALLFGRVFPGVPLLVAGMVLQLNPERAVLSIKNGEVTLTFHAGDAATLTFVDGELTELRPPETDNRFGARGKTTGP